MVNLRNISLYGGFHFHTSMNCTTRILWICFSRILDNCYLYYNLNNISGTKNLNWVNLGSNSLYGGFHFHTSMNCTARTLWIFFSRILHNLLLTLNLNKMHYSMCTHPWLHWHNSWRGAGIGTPVTSTSSSACRDRLINWKYCAKK